MQGSAMTPDDTAHRDMGLGVLATEKGKLADEERSMPVAGNGGYVGGDYSTGKGRRVRDPDASVASGRSWGEDSLPSMRDDIGKGTWYEAGYHMATTIATPAAYSPIPFAFASLTWGGGLSTLIVGIAVTWYCSILLASLNEWNGIRYVRYRDLSKSIWGPFGFWATVVFQQIASIGNNITIQIAAGLSAQIVYQTYRPGGSVSLQQFIIYFGIIELILSQLPHIHSLRFLNYLCTFCTIVFSTIVVGMCIHNRLPRDQVSYSLPGNKINNLMGVFSGLGTIAFTFGDAMLPEIQAVVGPPVAKNMYKGVSLCYSVITSCYVLIGIIGYWSFGNQAAAFIVSNLVAPTWPITVANLMLIIQVIGCYQIYCRPTYEFVEVRFMDITQSAMSRRNVIVRFILTLIYIVIITTLCCMLPFFADFVALCGAIGFTPLDFMLPALLYLTVRNPPWYVWVLNISIAVVYFAVAVLGSVGAVRFIVLDSVNYSLFANI